MMRQLVQGEDIDQVEEEFQGPDLGVLRMPGQAGCGLVPRGALVCLVVRFLHGALLVEPAKEASAGSTDGGSPSDPLGCADYSLPRTIPG